MTGRGLLRLGSRTAGSGGDLSLVPVAAVGAEFVPVEIVPEVPMQRAESAGALNSVTTDLIHPKGAVLAMAHGTGRVAPRYL